MLGAVRIAMVVAPKPRELTCSHVPSASCDSEHSVGASSIATATSLPPVVHAEPRHHSGAVRSPAATALIGQRANRPWCALPSTNSATSAFAAGSTAEHATDAVAP